MTKDKTALATRKLIDTIVELAGQKKAEHIVLFNPGKESSIADWFLVCEGTNEVHNRAIGNAILQGLKEIGSPPWHHEGIEQGRWILIDFIDIVVNIILPELRHYYELDKLWEQCEPVYVTDDAGKKTRRQTAAGRSGRRRKKTADVKPASGRS